MIEDAFLVALAWGTAAALLALAIAVPWAWWENRHDGR